MSNIRGLHDLNKEESGEDEKRNELFIGGVDNRGGGSGLAVEGPPTSSSRAGGGHGPGVFDAIVNRASQDAEAGLPPPSSSSENGGSNQRKITMYRNGFTVDDGPLRDLTSPESRAFLSSLERGQVPQELAMNSGGDPRGLMDLDVNLVDNRGEDYRAPPPPAYVAFSGPATTLGGGNPNSGAAAGATAFIFTTEGAAGVTIPEVDDSQPSTLLQVRTSQGKKLRIKLNQSATVLQLAAVIIRDTGADADRFTLSAGYPPADIMDGSLSLKDAGLLSAAITQKPV